MVIETIRYNGWEHCIRLSDGKAEVVATTDVGPRIIRLGAVGGPNLLFEAADQAGLTGGDEWRCYGGHRLWHAPEAKPRTYAGDNGPVAFELLADGVRLTQAIEPATGIGKQMELHWLAGRQGLEVIHRLTNHNLWTVPLAPWAITQMAPGGVAIMPQEPYAPHPDVRRPGDDPAVPGSFLPARSLALWGFTRLDDPRWSFLEKFILVRQDPAIAAPLKFGASNKVGWLAYGKGGDLLVKRFGWQEGARYPDLGCNAEIWTDPSLLEVETLGPMVDLEPGRTVEHRETWEFYRGVELPRDGARLEAALAPVAG
jgi:hypothetical protein